MLKLLSDENLNGDLVRALLLRNPQIDLLRVQDAGLSGADDDAVLSWAAAQGRIVLTHDRATLPGFAYRRVEAGVAMPGVIVVNDRMPPREAVEEICVVEACSETAEWNGRVLYLPL
jgi:hypothetical protein